MPNNDGISRASIEEVLVEFDTKRDALATFCNKTKPLIEEILLASGIKYQSVQARVKSREKLRNKYLDETRSYKRLDDITDQAAVRVITYYEDEVDKVSEVIQREFEIDPANSVDKRETEPDKFGYYALNYVCKYSGARTSQLEYRKFTDVWCEIQITSILRHAWSEIEHPWYDLKDAFPADIKRRFARMAALLEIAESEFLSLRKVQADYQKAVAVQVEANVPDLKIDAVSLRSLLERDPLVTEIDAAMAGVVGLKMQDALPDAVLEMRRRTVTAAGLTRIQEIRDLLKRFKQGLPEYLNQCKKEIWSDEPVGAEVYKGLCLYHLGLLVVNQLGEEATLAFLAEAGFRGQVRWDVSRQVTIGKAIAEKYPA